MVLAKPPCNSRAPIFSLSNAPDRVRRGCTRKEDGRDPHLARPGDSEAVGQWRERMGTAEAKEIYKERAATAETVNADVKTNRGLSSLAVRGSGKVLASALLVALTYDILRLLTLS